MRWVDRQLSPDEIDDDRLAQREHQFDILQYGRGDLAAMYMEAQRERRERQRAAGETAPGSASVGAQHAAPPPKHPHSMIPKNPRPAGELADPAVVPAPPSG